MAAPDVIIIGAPRSGTNMLRDVLTRRPGVVTWPCDEINGIWRHGSLDLTTDEIPPARATMRQKRFIADQFDRIRRRERGHTLVEKTCANSLRVEYIAALRPDARYVLITRDGIDATASAMARWNAPLDWRYTARKARFVPAADLLRTALKFASNLPGGAPRSRPRARLWGPRFAGIEDMVHTRPLEEVCAAQWQRCVELSVAAVHALPERQLHRVSYEDFVTAPADRLASLLSFLELPTNDAGRSVAGISSASVGKGRVTLEAGQLERVQQMLSPTMRRLGYV